MPNVPTVLIADEKPPFVASLACQVRRAGIHSLAATNPHLALMLAHADRPDLVVLDLYQSTGRTLLSRLKEDPSTMDIKVLVLTDFEGKDEDLRATCQRMGASDFELKPANLTVVDKIIRLAWGTCNAGKAANDARKAEKCCAAS